MRTFRSARARDGFTLLEIVLSSSLVAALVLASTMAFSSNLAAVERAKRMTHATLFLETVMEDVTAQPYANLLALNGNQVVDGATLLRSAFAADLSVFQASVDVIQVRAVLTDLGSGESIGDVTMLRVRR